MGPFARDGLSALGAATGYVACAVIGTVLSVPPDGFAVIWPATAFLIGVLLLLPPRRWWCIAGVIPAHFVLAAVLQSHAPPVVVATQILGNLALAFATVAAVRRTIGPDPRFDTFHSLARFIAVAGIAVPAVVNTLILAVHLATGWTEDLWGAWQQWMIGGFFATITIPPLMVLTARSGVTGRPVAPPALRTELTLIAGLLFMLSLFAFGGLFDTTDGAAALLAPLPLLLWAAVRTGVGGTSLSLLVLAGGIVVQALLHNGPFAPRSPIQDVFSLQMFLVTRGVPVLLLAALMDERRRTADLLQQSEARMQLAASATGTGLWQWDIAVRRLWATANCRTMFDLADPAMGTPLDFLGAIHPDDRARVGEAIEAALADGTTRPAIEFRLPVGDATRWFILDMRTELGTDGRPARVHGVFRDVSERVAARAELDRLNERLAAMQDEERRRIAQELHDSTAQHLVAANLNLLNLRSYVPAQAQALIDEVRQSFREATTEIRTFTYLLHPPQLDEEGLRSVLLRYVPGFERRTGVRTALRVTETVDRLPADQQHALLRITQESLSNVQRHAQAKQVSIDLRCIAGNVHLIVRDDGKGIGRDAGEQLGERLRLGVGIPAMAARARQLGGRIEVHARGKGTTIHVAIPMSQAIGAELDALAGGVHPMSNSRTTN